MRGGPGAADGGGGVFCDWDKFEGGGPGGKVADDEDTAEGGGGWGADDAVWDFCCNSDAAGASPLEASDLADADGLFLYILPLPLLQSI